jgi:hypothetical protein
LEWELLLLGVYDSLDVGYKNGMGIVLMGSDEVVGSDGKRNDDVSQGG